MAIDKNTVEKIIGEKVKPYILEHGGDIAVTKIEDGIVYITLYGNCQGCPSAQLTTESVVAERLKEELGDAVKDVVLQAEMSPDIIAFAKDMLRRNHNEGGVC